MNGGKLIGVGLLFIAALSLFLSGSSLSPTQEINKLDTVTENWTQEGNLSGNLEATNGAITLSGDGTGTFTLNKTYAPVNSTLTFDNLIIDSEITDDNDRVEVRFFGIDRDGTVIDSKNIIAKDGVSSYEPLEGEYSGYYYQVTLESSDNSVPSVNRLTVDYKEQKPLTNNNLSSDLLAWLLVLMGIGLLFL